MRHRKEWVEVRAWVTGQLIVGTNTTLQDLMRNCIVTEPKSDNQAINTLQKSPESLSTALYHLHPPPKKPSDLAIALALAQVPSQQDHTPKEANDLPKAAIHGFRWPKVHFQST
jgi:hypothetical protein